MQHFRLICSVVIAPAEVAAVFGSARAREGRTNQSLHAHLSVMQAEHVLLKTDGQPANLAALLLRCTASSALSLIVFVVASVLHPPAQPGS